MTAFHERQLPVVLTTVVYRDDLAASVFRARLPALNVLTPDSHWVAFDPRLPRIDRDHCVEKTHASAFHGTELDDWLRGEGVDSLVVTGLTTSGCVRATAVDGLQYNYRVFVPREACGDRDLSAHEANLYDLNAKYADVVTVDEVLASLAV
jgi:nicotinamidase-related amidase